MKRMKAGDAIFTMDPRLRRSPESTVAVERVLKLAQQCLLPSRQSRPSMKECAKTLWEIRRDFREKRSSSPPTTHRSDNFVQRDARRNGGTLSVHEEDGDNYKFVSAWLSICIRYLLLRFSYLVSFLFLLQEVKKKMNWFNNKFITSIRWNMVATSHHHGQLFVVSYMCGYK